jgi:hypothetical protein
MRRFFAGITMALCGTASCAVGDRGPLFEPEDEPVDVVQPGAEAVRVPQAIAVEEATGEGGRRSEEPICFHGDSRTTDAACGMNARGHTIVGCHEGQWVEAGCADPDVCLDGEVHPGITACGLRGSIPRSCVMGEWVEEARCVEPPACACPSTDACVSEACDPHAMCRVVIGDPVCVCEGGYEGNGAFCVDIDECAKSPCGPNETCSNSDGGFTCACADGFRQTSNGCEDIDECLDDPCHVEASCDNMDGTYICTCPPGFAGDGHTCFDPCDLAPCAQHATCSSHPDGIECTCDDGYVGDGFVACFLD